ncbi:MAG: hypothetical protein AB7N80_03785 [Bdellovibrionales bacterium]
MKRTTAYMGLALIWTLVGCGQKILEDSNSLDTISTSVESGITAVSAVADDQVGSSLVMGSKPTFSEYASRVFNQIVPEAQAAACSRALYEMCVSGVSSATRSTLYSNCSLPSGRTLNGSVTLTYSDLSCNLDVGDSVNRSYDFAMNGLYGGQLLVSSASHTDYRGNSIGGGGNLTRLGANSWQIDVAGKRKTFVRSGNTFFDIQVRTTAPMNVLNTLARNGRVVDGGSFEVIHNLAKFTATYTPSQLTWSGTCCHPISGSLSVSYSGSVTGSGSVTFNGCGSATLVKGGLSQDININYCE